MSGVDPLDALGRELSSALRRELPRLRRRRRVTVAATVLALAAAVPATGAVTDWAGLAGGETPVPTQVPPGLRLQLAGAADEGGRWRLEVYRAALGGGGVGLCVFLSRETGGTGRCTAEGSLGSLVDAGDDPQVRVGGGIVRGPVARVELAVARQDARPGRVVAVTPARAPAAELSARNLPGDLRSYAVVLDREERGVQGVRAVDLAGRTIATSGRAAPAAPRTPSRPSPVLLEEPTP